MDKKPQEACEEYPATRSNGKDEMNLAEFPIALLTERVPKGLKTIESQDEFFDERTGKVIVRKRVITGSDKYGLPTAKDDEVIVGLIQLTREANNFTERTVNFSRRELINRICWPLHGKSYHRLARSLACWVDLGLHYEKAWYDNARKSWVDEHFHIIDRVSLYDREEQVAQPFQKLSSFTWSNAVFRSFQAGYLKNLNLDFYFSLSGATTKRMYRFLDKRFYLKPSWDFELKDFAFNHIGLSRSGYEGSGHLAKKLRPAIKELEAKGFLEPLTERARFERRSRSEWRVLFVRRQGVPSGLPLFEPKASPATPEPRPQPERKPKAEPKSTPLERELVSRGVTASTARELVASFTEERITAQIEQADWLREKKPQKIADLGAYLVDAIREGYAAPAGFESKAERQKQQEAEKAKWLKEQEEARRREAHQRREAEVGRQVKQAWELLTDEEKRQLEEQAWNAADEEDRRLYEEAKNKHIRKMALRLIREQYLRKKLSETESIEERPLTEQGRPRP